MYVVVRVLTLDVWMTVCMLSLMFLMASALYRPRDSIAVIIAVAAMMLAGVYAKW